MEENIFIKGTYLQNCGDSLKIIKKTSLKKNGHYLYECEFQKYPYIILVLKDHILRGVINNPQIEIEEFVNKIHLQNCGDSLKVISKSDKKQGKDFLWKCEFIKYPCIIFATKGNILKGNLNNPQIEQVEFIDKIWPQNCGDSLKIIKKTDLKFKNKKSLFKCQFLKYPCEILALKEHILRKVVDNPALPWKNKDTLLQYIKDNFEEKPTLKELADSLNINITTVGQKINEFCLRDYIQYYPNLQEDSLRNYINILIQTEIYNDFKYEIDVFCKDKNIGFEYNGNYWHSELFKQQNYHQEKSLYFEEKGIQLVHIFEYEFLEKEDLIKSFIKSKLGIFEKKIGASKCKVKELSVDIYRKFCEENHLQGKADARIKLGLFYQEELIQIMSFSCPRFTDKYEYEIIRECSKQGYIILGGKEKLWSYFIKKYNPNSVISYCDFSKFTGNSYLKLGFKKERLNKPGFVWWDSKINQVFWRSPEKNQEMKEKYIKIYDCGQLVFTWNK